MQEASEQTGKLANSGGRFTVEEPRYSVHLARSSLLKRILPFPSGEASYLLARCEASRISSLKQHIRV